MCFGGVWALDRLAPEFWKVWGRISGTSWRLAASAGSVAWVFLGVKVAQGLSIWRQGSFGLKEATGELEASGGVGFQAMQAADVMGDSLWSGPDEAAGARSEVCPNVLDWPGEMEVRGEADVK